MSNWTISRTDFNLDVLMFPEYPMVMPIFEKSAELEAKPPSNEFHRDFDGWPFLADLSIGVNVAGETDILNRSTSVESMSRAQLAFYGFKPDRNFARPNWPITMRFSRVQDLEEVGEMRESGLVKDARITSHVVPYVFASIVHGGGTLDFNALGYTANGLLLPNPWPRVLNCYRLVNSSGTIKFPSGPTSGGRGRQAVISDNGTMLFPAAMQSGMTVDGEYPLAADTYTIELGHVEEQPVQSVNGLSQMPFGPERWPTAATP